MKKNEEIKKEKSISGKARGAHFFIVEGRFYVDLIDQLIKGACKVLQDAGATFDIITLPGALEVPIAISMLIDKAECGEIRADGFIALGAIIRGETTHYDTVSNESARAIMDIAIGMNFPIGNGILTVENRNQAEVRADPDGEDKGGGAARAALALYILQKSIN